jgi:hypothetical protein
MTWDVFVSHASEDKEFVRELAIGLQNAGLGVWFDEFALEAGDSLRRSIDKGLRESRYGVVVLSPNFFRKEWPQRELDGFVARDDGKSKVLIPVWYQVTAAEVRAYSPPLADKLSVEYAGSLDGVLSRLLRAIRREDYAKTNWNPEPLRANGLSLIPLPVRPALGRALCVGQFCISNAEYARFVSATGHSQPVGDAFVNGRWLGPFQPWQDPDFQGPEKPVVCVNFFDAIEFCRWASSPRVTVSLPTAELWEYAAAGAAVPSKARRILELADPSTLPTKANAPSLPDFSGSRANAFGVSDLFGNVWQWCGANEDEQDERHLSRITARFSYARAMESELRGGSFLDDLGTVNPAVRSHMLEHGASTSHNDLGFRVCAAVSVGELDRGMVEILKTRPSLSERIWRTAIEGTDPTKYRR